jgi:ribosomal protein S18 acetylase RimI-like enzyme
VGEPLTPTRHRLPAAVHEGWVCAAARTEGHLHAEGLGGAGHDRWVSLPSSPWLRFVALDESVPDGVLDGVLAVALSNPEFLATHEGSAGEPGHHDRSMLERDLAVSALDPDRHSYALVLADGGTVVGWADVLDRHPRDGVPWIGLLEIHGDHHRRGYGRQAAAALAAHQRSRGETRLRVGVDEGNDAAAAFWASLGYREVDVRERPSPSGPLSVSVLELSLDG